MPGRVRTCRGLYPPEVGRIRDHQTDLPRIARDPKLTARIDATLREIPTCHHLYCHDSRDLSFLAPESVHLIVTSPPYWTLKEYRHSDGQLGHVETYDDFLKELDKVWQHCLRVLVPGGRLIIVVGDVCLSRRRNGGRHTVVPLHASIQERCRALGFDNLAPIIWHKIANAVYEVENGTGGFLGKPYERGHQERHRVHPDAAEAGRLSQPFPRDQNPERDLRTEPPRVVPTDLDRTHGCLDEAAPGAVPARTGRTADPNVQLRRRHRPRPVRRHRDHHAGGLSSRTS
jgi:hypothetical protein